ncbi:CDP-glucose 4,6-dehydratase [Marinomonas piezotolerans]|uniref:CDP-glucose 4,6-dehydratase n=1 Tax=Marinomonas piezotolerans TaxID=2213058 RepID=A0A370U8B7_9GAMM|nr:CDP-glucose 4,6-dehydratase [Marinomonas piezotolerans]RDL44040.1 CDP-glucose 4,6-dehydratase [Marinomonas piezotolerans]
MSLKETFRGKRVLVTGHTGFKGSWLSLWLSSLGAHVYGVSDVEYDEPSNFSVSRVPEVLTEDIRCDIRDLDQLKKHVSRIQPDFLFHLAAQPIVRQSYSDPMTTFTTNAIGSLNIFESIREMDSELVCIMITSDKVYENKEWIWGYREQDQLGGIDPYSASKSMAEIGIRSYYKSFLAAKENIKVAVGRAGNVIGGGDWASDRIVPDSMRAWAAGDDVILRNPHSTRPWQHVLEPLGGYLLLAQYIKNAEKSYELEAFNFGPSAEQNASVGELVNLMGDRWGECRVEAEQNLSTQKEAGLLRLNCDKAQSLLGWTAVLDLRRCANMTVDWYKAHYGKQEDMQLLTFKQIAEYEEGLYQVIAKQTV